MVTFITFILTFKVVVSYARHCQSTDSNFDYMFIITREFYATFFFFFFFMVLISVLFLPLKELPFAFFCKGGLVVMNSLGFYSFGESLHPSFSEGQVWQV